jgi:peptidoglycan hydrolase-like protein with peptidoglycan-binding domain
MVDETPVGSAFVTGKDRSDSARSVNAAVKAFQAMAGMPFLERDGWLGPKTAEAGIKLQQSLGVEADGIFGPVTMKRAFMSLVYTKADLYAVPRDILRGIVGFESTFDPGAVGVSGWDHGFAQINLDPRNGNGSAISFDFAMTPDLALDWTAKILRTVFNRTYTTKRGISTELAWNVAILNHNSPKNATELLNTGQYPTEQSRAYVDGVRSYS